MQSCASLIDSAGVQYRPQLKPALMDFGLQHYSRMETLSAVLVVSTSVIYVNTWTTTHLPTTEGWKAELSRLADP